MVHLSKVCTEEKTQWYEKELYNIWIQWDLKWVHLVLNPFVFFFIKEESFFPNYFKRAMLFWICCEFLDVVETKKMASEGSRSTWKASYQGDDNKVQGKIIVTMCVIENSDEVAPLSLGATCTTKISRTDLRVMKWLVWQSLNYLPRSTTTKIHSRVCVSVCNCVYKWHTHCVKHNGSQLKVTFNNCSVIIAI